jgi:5,10-methylenetetrahydromethanopterin reductase
MEYGIHLATSAHHWKAVQRAEEMGFKYAWFYDTQLLNADVFVAMAAAAMKTSKIKLCTGVLVPSNRIAPVTASALASLNALAPGRIVFGVATGYTARRAMGLPAMKLAHLEEYVKTVMGLLRGEMVEWNGEGGTHKIKFLNPEIGAININDPIPLHMSAFAPRARAMVAKLGAGWLSGGDPLNATKALAAMQSQWQEAGRDIKDLYSTILADGCVLADGEPADSPRARAQAGPHAMLVFHDLAEQEELGTLGYQIPPQFKAQFEAYRKIYQTYQPPDARYLSNHRGHLMFLRPEEEALIAPELIRSLSLTGTKAELIEAVRAYRAAGFSQFAVHLRIGHEFEMLNDWMGVIERA